MVGPGRECSELATAQRSACRESVDCRGQLRSPAGAVGPGWELILIVCGASLTPPRLWDQLPELTSGDRAAADRPGGRSPWPVQDGLSGLPIRPIAAITTALKVPTY